MSSSASECQPSSPASVKWIKPRNTRSSTVSKQDRAPRKRKSSKAAFDDGTTQLTLSQTFARAQDVKPLTGSTKIARAGPPLPPPTSRSRILYPVFDSSDIEVEERPLSRRRFTHRSRAPCTPEPDVRGPPGPACWAIPHIRQTVIASLPRSTLPKIAILSKDSFIDTVLDLYSEIDYTVSWANAHQYIGFSTDPERMMRYRDAVRRIVVKRVGEDAAHMTKLLTEFRSARTLMSSDNKRQITFHREKDTPAIKSIKYAGDVTCPAQGVEFVTALPYALPTKAFPPHWHVDKRVRLHVTRKTDPNTPSAARAAGKELMQAWAGGKGPFGATLASVELDIPVAWDDLCDRLDELPEDLDTLNILPNANGRHGGWRLITAAARVNVKHLTVKGTHEFRSTLSLELILSSWKITYALPRFHTVTLYVSRLFRADVDRIISLATRGQLFNLPAPYVGARNLNRLRLVFDNIPGIVNDDGSTQTDEDGNAVEEMNDEGEMPPLSILADWVDLLLGGKECEVIVEVADADWGVDGVLSRLLRRELDVRRESKTTGGRGWRLRPC